jgi:nucleotide-binding universal stress UspA family protein
MIFMPMRGSPPVTTPGFALPILPHGTDLALASEAGEKRMERILVGLDGRQSNLEGIQRAIQLAIRIEATVFILVVVRPTAAPARQELFQDLHAALRNRLELLMEMARGEGVEVKFYMARGDYGKELIRFTRENAITLVVLGLPGTGSQTTEEFHEWLAGLRHRINCRIELVHEKGVA